MMQGSESQLAFPLDERETQTFSKAEDNADVFTGGPVFLHFSAGDESKVAAALM